MKKSCPIPLFDYKDYRVFLRDWFAWAKKSRRGFSFRMFSQLAGLASPNFLKLVMEGDRNLSTEGIAKFVQGLDLNKAEAHFFKHLVLFNQSKDVDDQVAHEKRLMNSRKISQIKPVEKDQYFLYGSWVHPVVLELISSRSFDGTPAWLVAHIMPIITEAQAQKSLELLERLGFIEKGSDGRWRHATPLVTTGPEAASPIMTTYHRNLLRLCDSLLPEIDADQRDVSSLAIGIARSRIPELKKRVQELRQEIIRQFTTDAPTEEVIFLNMQLFPVTGVAD